MLYITIDSYYRLAIISLETRKIKKLEKAMESYLKLLDLYPKSSYLAKAENIYESCQRMKSNLKQK